MENIKRIILQEINNVMEDVIEIPDIPNTMNFWHGGNLENYSNIIAQKNGRYEYGAGLYLTTHYGTAEKYSRGSRKLYLVVVEKGNDINDSTLPVNEVMEFINTYVIGRKRKDIVMRMQKYFVDDLIKAYYVDNIILNEKAISSTNTPALRQFYVDNNIHYNIVDNAFGWGEKMMVLYDMDKIVKTQKLNPRDKLPYYDLH